MSCREPGEEITWVPRHGVFVAEPQPERGCAVVIRQTTLPPTRAIAWEVVLVWPGCGEEVVVPAGVDREAITAVATAWVQGAFWGRTRGVIACVGVVQRKEGAFTPLSSNTKLLLEELVGEMLEGDAP